MSTKASRECGTFEFPDNKKIRLHLYDETADFDSSIYLEISGDVTFEAAPNSVTVKIPAAIWDEIRKHGISSYTKYKNKSDEELMAIANEKAKERVEEYKNADEKGRKFLGIVGMLAFGSIDDPEEVQALSYFDWIKMLRDSAGKRVKDE